MKAEAGIRPLSIEANIYALCDGAGRTIGTGTLEVCEVLLCLITKTKSIAETKARVISVPGRANVRAAIVI